MEHSLHAFLRRTILLLTVIASMLSGVFAKAQDHNLTYNSAAKTADQALISLARVKGKDGNWVNVSYRATTDITKLKAVSPKVLFEESEDFRARLAQQCGKKGGVTSVIQFAKKFPVESATFNFAVGMSAGEQVTEDPAYARHFVEQNLIDKMAHVSFAGFMLGNRAAANFFSMTGLTYDPCRILRREPMAAAERFEQKEFQKIMGIVAGPVGMATGLIISDALHQALTDKNIRMCGSLQIGKFKNDEKKTKEAQKACEVAYEDWVLGGGEKIRALVPDMISMTIVSGIMSAPQLGAEGVKALMKTRSGLALKQAAVTALDEASLRVTWVMSTRMLIVDGATAVMTIARVVPTPISKIVVAVGAVGSTYVFLKLNDKIEAPIKKSWDTYWQGSDISKSIAQLHTSLNELSANGWVFKTKPKPDACDPRLQIPIMETGMSFTPLECFETPVVPADVIKQLGKQEKKWRDYIMADTSTAASNWQDYVVNFTNMFTDARKFYADILDRVWHIRFTPNDKDNDMNRTVPLWGVPVDLDAWKAASPDFDICAIPDETVGLIDNAIILVALQIKEEGRWDIVPPQFWATIKPAAKGKWLPSIKIEQTKTGRFAIGDVDHYDVNELKMMLEGFEAMDCKNFKLENIERDLHKSAKLATPQELQVVRWNRYTKAISTLYRELLGAVALGAHAGVPMMADDENYWDAAGSNMFMKVNYALGGPEPMYPGVGYVKSRRNDPNDITKDLRDLHPMELREVATKQMPDYLMASMVCGPTADKTMIKKVATTFRVDGLKNPFVPVGWSVEFQPPRIVPDLGYDLCARGAPAQPLMVPSSIMSPIGLGVHTPVADPYMSIWNIKGKSYRGFLEVVKAFAPASIIGDKTGSAFSTWWSNNLNKQALPLFREFRMRFVHDVIEAKYFPALANDQFSSDTYVGIERKYLPWLASKPGEQYVWYHELSKGLPKGFNNAAMLSINEHLALIAPMVLPKNAKPDDVAKFKALSNDILVHMKIALMMIGPFKNLRPGMELYSQVPEVPTNEDKTCQRVLTEAEANDPDSSEKAALSKQEIHDAVKTVKSALDAKAIDTYKRNNIDVQNAILNLKAFGHAQAAAQGPAKDTLISLVDAIADNMLSVVTDIDQFHGFLVSIRLAAAE